MNRNSLRVTLVALAIALTPLTMSQSATAATFGSQFGTLSPNNPNLIEAGTCWSKRGPFQTQNQAYFAVQQAQARGYGTGPVFGEGGLYSNYSNRRWFFALYYDC